MRNKKIRFGAGIAVILIAIGFFAISGFEEGKAYYKTLDELEAMTETDLQGKRLRVGGIVSEGSIERDGREVHFQIEQEELTLAVHYVGSQPVPDTFKDGVEALVEGHRREDGTFEADQIQAKCASKYEAEYGAEAQEAKAGEEKSY